MERFSFARDCGSIPHGDSTDSMFLLNLVCQFLSLATYNNNNNNNNNNKKLLQMFLNFIFAYFDFIFTYLQ